MNDFNTDRFIIIRFEIDFVLVNNRIFQNTYKDKSIKSLITVLILIAFARDAFGFINLTDEPLQSEDPFNQIGSALITQQIDVNKIKSTFAESKH